MGAGDLVVDDGHSCLNYQVRVCRHFGAFWQVRFECCGCLRHDTLLGVQLEL